MISIAFGVIVLLTMLVVPAFGGETVVYKAGVFNDPSLFSHAPIYPVKPAPLQPMKTIPVVPAFKIRLPPPQYDRIYEGALTIAIVETIEGLRHSCNQPNVNPIGCAFRYSPTACSIFLISKE